MKKKIVTYLALVFVLANTLFPAFQPSQGDNTVQPLGFWEKEWI